MTGVLSEYELLEVVQSGITGLVAQRKAAVAVLRQVLSAALELANRNVLPEGDYLRLLGAVQEKVDAAKIEFDFTEFRTNLRPRPTLAKNLPNRNSKPSTLARPIPHSPPLVSSPRILEAVGSPPPATTEHPIPIFELKTIPPSCLPAPVSPLLDQLTEALGKLDSAERGAMINYITDELARRLAR